MNHGLHGIDGIQVALLTEDKQAGNVFFFQGANYGLCAVVARGQLMQHRKIVVAGIPFEIFGVSQGYLVIFIERQALSKGTQVGVRSMSQQEDFLSGIEHIQKYISGIVGLNGFIPDRIQHKLIALHSRFGSFQNNFSRCEKIVIVEVQGNLLQ